MRYRTRTVDASDWLRRPEPWILAVLLVVEAVGVLGYFALTSADVRAVRYVLYPFVWINVGVLAVVATTTPTADRRTRHLAMALATGYFLLLALLAGLVSVDVGALLGAGHGHSHAHVHGLQVTMTAPGWGPRVGYAGDVLTVNLVPFRVIGYLALAYLVYATLLDVAGAALSGLVGLGSCLSCLPIVGSLTAGLAGGSGAVAALASLPVDVSTAVFVASVLLLTLRPGHEP